jgi:hypothetical protein
MRKNSVISDEIIEKATELALQELDSNFFIMHTEEYNYGKALRELTEKYIAQIINTQNTPLQTL